MTAYCLAYVSNIAEADLLGLSFLAWLAGFLSTHIFERRSVGTLAGYAIVQLVAGYFGLLHFRAGLSSIWLLPGLVVPILAAFAGSLFVRVPAAKSTLNLSPPHPRK